MGSETLRKMIRAGKGAAPLGVDYAAAALTEAAGKIARQKFDVTAEFSLTEQSRQPLGEMLDGLPEPCLCLSLRVGDTRRGILCLDGLLINALVELLTGATDKQVSRQARPPTRIDTELGRDFCMPMLDLLPGALAAAAGHPVLPALTVEGAATDPARLFYALENTPHQVLTGQLDFQAGIRGGGLTLALPADLWEGGGTDTAAHDPEWTARLAGNVLRAPLVMQVVLEPLPLTLGRALALKAGDVIPFPANALSDLRLRSVDGVDRLRGRLGQVNSSKAVCISGFVRDSGMVSADAAFALPEAEVPLAVTQDKDQSNGPDMAEVAAVAEAPGVGAKDAAIAAPGPV